MKEGGREGGGEGGEERGREGYRGKEGEREGGRERGREGGREGERSHERRERMTIPLLHFSPTLRRGRERFMSVKLMSVCGRGASSKNCWDGWRRLGWRRE